MCLHLTKEQNKAIVATENIICYKSLESDNVSYYSSYKYKKGEINPKVDLKVVTDIWYEVTHINEGYHSRRTSKGNNRLFMIPKGTTFYVGGENETAANNYVSETIVLLGRNNKFNRWYYTWKYNLKEYIDEEVEQSL